MKMVILKTGVMVFSVHRVCFTEEEIKDGIF